MISIILNNFNGMRYLTRALETLRAQQRVETELIVVDRESTDGSSAYLASLPGIRLLSEPAASGLSAGYAAGAAVARGDHLFFCNEDMWFDPLCLSRLQLQIDPERRHGAADPWQWTYDAKTLIHAGVRFRRCVWDPNSALPTRGFSFTEPLCHGATVPIPCAGAVMIHRRMYEELGGWDTTFYLDQEDVDLFLRAWQHAWYCVTVPDAHVYHAVGATNALRLHDGQPVGERRYISARSNAAVIGLKYFSPRAAALWVPAILIFPLLQDLARLRPRRALWDIKALLLTFSRSKHAAEYRRTHRLANRTRPGEQFFRQDDLLTEPGEHRWAAA